MGVSQEIHWVIWVFPKIRGTFLGVPIIWTIVYWGLYRVPLFWETTIWRLATLAAGVGQHLTGSTESESTGGFAKGHGPLRGRSYDTSSKHVAALQSDFTMLGSDKAPPKAKLSFNRQSFLSKTGPQGMSRQPLEQGDGVSSTFALR